MNINGIPNAPNLATAGNTAPVPAAGKPATKGYTEISPDALLALKGSGSGDAKKSNESLPPPPAKPGSSEALDKLSQLNSPQVSADLFAVMELFQKMSQQMRDSGRTERMSARSDQMAAMQSAADKMKDAAAQRLTSAIVQGAFQIAGGIAQGGIAGTGIPKDKKSGGDVEKTAPKPDSIRDGKADLIKAMTTGQALGGIGSASVNYQAQRSDAEKKEMEAQSKISETSAQHANEMMQQMMDVIRDVRDKLSSIQQAATEANRSIARNI